MKVHPAMATQLAHPVERRVPRRLAAAVSLVLVVGQAALAAPAQVAQAGQAAPRSWSVSPTAMQNGSADGLQGISCLSATHCVAVGSQNNESALLTAIQVWNGVAWLSQPSPSPSSDLNFLNAVSCAGAAFCAAVGFTFNGSVYDQLIETWNGSAWSATTGTNPASNRLLGVSCLSATDCIAVGDTVVGATTDTVVEAWNGASWSVVASPNVATATVNILESVACPGASACTATGYARVGGVNRTLAERWNGAAWSLGATPNRGSDDNDLGAVACTGAAHCLAVGAYANSSGTILTLGELWNGTSWSLLPTPNAPGVGNGALDGIACPAPAQCVAVGYSTSPNLPLAERWNGSTWSLTPTATLPAETSPGLQGIACPTAFRCFATGGYVPAGVATPGAQPQNLIEAAIGASWSVQAGPPDPGDNGSLSGVSCVAANDCVAAGTTSHGEPMIETWNGNLWSLAPVQYPANPGIGLNGVSCASATFCVAVGSYFNGSATDGLIEMWSGSGSWTMATMGDPSHTFNELDGVSCSSASFCIAVGRDRNGPTQTLSWAESWNGSAWTTLASYDPSSTYNVLNGVSCPSGTSCMAVGYELDGNHFVPMVQDLGPSTVSLVPTPTPTGAYDSLTAISCLTLTSCTAVGFTSNQSDYQPLVESSTGGTWALKSSPNPGGTDTTLSGVACTSTSDCVAVGSYDQTNMLTLVDSWNGTSWSWTASPSPGEAVLRGVSCAGAASCAAVGAASYLPSFLAGQTLAEVGQTLAEVGT
jgi:hypothetical protein